MHPINPAPGVLRMGGVAVDAGCIVIRFVPLKKTASCPDCGRRSGRVHSRYWRRAADVPLSGNRVEIKIRARRFFCDGVDCSRRIFCERFSGVLEPHARLTHRARAALLELAHAGGGEQAARVARLLGFKLSGASLVALQRRERLAFQPPRAIGVDEFAWRKRSRYGTLVVDLERRRPVDLLPTDSVKEFSHWLERHPPVAVIARDRDEVFARAARDVVPGAVQVADRFHLAKNVLDTFREFLLSHRWKLRDDEEPFAGQAAPPAADEPGPRPTARKRLMWEQVRALAKEGHAIRAIARALGTHRRTVRRYINSAEPTVYRRSVHRPGKLDVHLEYLLGRWNEGVHNATKLYREIRERGYDGSASMLRQTVARWRQGKPRRRAMRPAPPIRLAMRWRTSLDEEETAELATFLELNPDLAIAYGLKESFREAMAARDPVRLDQWLASAAASGIVGFLRLAKSMRHDYQAVSAAFTSPWSNGQCEGQITRVKLIKRIGYGRANPDLLRARVLHRMAVA